MSKTNDKPPPNQIAIPINDLSCRALGLDPKTFKPLKYKKPKKNKSK